MPQARQGALSSDGCTFSRELSEHYGEPVFLCASLLDGEGSAAGKC